MNSASEDSDEENEWKENVSDTTPKKQRRTKRRDSSGIGKRTDLKRGKAQDSPSSHQEQVKEHATKPSDAEISLAHLKLPKSKYSWYLDKLNALILLQVVHWVFATQILCLWRSSCDFSSLREYAKSWPALVNPTAPSHGGSLVIGTSVIVIGLCVPAGLILVTCEKRKALRSYLLISLALAVYSMVMAIFFFSRAPPRFEQLPSHQRFYVRSADFELDAYTNRLLYAFTFFGSGCVSIMVCVLCKRFLSVLPPDEVKGFPKEENAPLLDDLERGDLKESKHVKVDKSRKSRRKRSTSGATPRHKSDSRRARKGSFEL